MKRLAICCPFYLSSFCNGETTHNRTVVDLNGTWNFNQTTTAFPPAEFTAPTGEKIISSKFLNEGDANSYKYFDLNPLTP